WRKGVADHVEGVQGVHRAGQRPRPGDRRHHRRGVRGHRQLAGCRRGHAAHLPRPGPRRLYQPVPRPVPEGLSVAGGREGRGGADPQLRHLHQHGHQLPDRRLRDLHAGARHHPAAAPAARAGRRADDEGVPGVPLDHPDQGDAVRALHDVAARIGRAKSLLVGGRHGVHGGAMRSPLSKRPATTGGDLALLAARLRSLIEATVASEAPVEALRAAAAAVEAGLAALAPFVPVAPSPRYPEARGYASPNDMMPFDPVIGRLSPVAPPVEFAWQDGRSIGRATFGTPYEGPPGCVHGGVLAAVFDQVLNIANLSSGGAGPTARLALRYRRPTPLRTPLVFEGWVERKAGRRVHTRGRCLHGDEVTVEAEGVFVLVPVERVLRMLDKYNQA